MVNNNKNLYLPDWMANISLRKAVQRQVDKHSKILAINLNVNEMQQKNCTIRLPIEVRILKEGWLMYIDHSIGYAHFILKAQQNITFQSKILSQLQMFFREKQMYHCILPKFQKLYKDVGKTVQFGPRPYKLDKKIGLNYILLEDLRVKKFTNANRLVGFELAQMKEVLKKIAEFHAASVCFVEKYGRFDKLFRLGVYTKANKEILREINDSKLFLSQLQRWRIGGKYYKKLAATEDHFINRLMKEQAVKSDEFNVLNHCDCWTNNVMFQYNNFGNIEQTLLLDYQVVKYGSPANDLIFIILSSANKDIKLREFDNLVQFYFYYLLENLNILKYRQPLPHFKKLQLALANSGLAAYCVVSKVLPIVMLQKFEDDSSDNYQTQVKYAMYTNRKYIQAMNELLPWMDNRGLLDWK